MSGGARNRILLLGAGFSHNWKDWLAKEIDEYLVGQLEIDRDARSLLVGSRSKGFEGVLDSQWRADVPAAFCPLLVPLSTTPVSLVTPLV